MLRFAWQTLALARVPRRDPERVRALARRRLVRLVRHAIAYSPYYRERYRSIDPRRFRLEELPPSSKNELMARFDEVVTDPAIKRADLEQFVDSPANEGRWFLDRYAPSHTSGSQGQPMLLVQPRATVELLFSLQMTRGNARRASLGEAIRRFVRPARLAVVTLKRGFYPSASAFEYMPPVAQRFVKLLWLSQTDDDVIDRLNAFRPTALTAYAGVLELLAIEAQAGRLRLAPELAQITNNSEVLTERARDRVESAFGLRVMDNYATGECAFLTNGCRTDKGAHVNADWAILENVDKAGNAVPAGTPGARVLITNLANYVQPIIRYEIGDEVTMAQGPCSCGNLLPRVEHIEGRSADTFWIKDGDRDRTVIGSVFKNAFDYIREVREWQAIQVERNRVRIRLEPLPGERVDLERARSMLSWQLDLYGFLPLLQIDFEVVPRLLPDPGTGKYRRMKSEVGAPLEQLRTIRIDGPETSASGPHRTLPVAPKSKRKRDTASGDATH